MSGEEANAYGGPFVVEHIGFRAPGHVEIMRYDEWDLSWDAFRLRTLYCGLSTGTELTHFQATNPYLHARWDDDLKLFIENDGVTHYPLPFTGYMQVGRVVASRWDGANEGDVVSATYGHKSGHTVFARNELYYKLPADLDPMLGIYVSQMGPICANGILHADEEAYGAAAPSFGCGVRGKRVVIAGTGVIGLFTGMMCQWAGASEVAILGRNAWKLERAARLGMTPLNTNTMDAGWWAKTHWHDGLGNRGADVAFQCSGSDELLGQCLRALRPQCAVIDLGFYQGGAGNLMLGREFHHNGLKHICAQIYRVPRLLAGAWNHRRLAETTLSFLQNRGAAVKSELITHVLPFRDAQQAFDLLSHDGEQALQVVLACE